MYRRLQLRASACWLFIMVATTQMVMAQTAKWDVNQPQIGNYKEVNFTVKEGTWMNVDVAPDGKNIVFDLLGDIYTMPVSGGKATLLRGGHAFEVQPRFNADGSKILFTSDAGGGDNIWVMNADGSNARQVTKENFRLLNNAYWSPDGQYIVARKHFTSTRSLGAGEMWLYHISGGNGMQLTERKNSQQDVNEPVFSPDGRYVYYSEDTYAGGFFQYNKDPNNQIFEIKRYDRETGKTENVTGGPGGAFRPQLSKDGKWLSFVKRVRTKTVLFVRNLETGEEKPVYDQLSKDQQESWTIFGIYTGYNWMPGNEHIIIWSGGKIIKVAVNGFNDAAEIPFACNVKQRIYDAVHTAQNINPDKFNVNVIRQAITSPDGQWLVFSAVGALYKKQLPNGQPQRITNDNAFEFEPSFSPDGKQLVYISWNDTAAGAINVVNWQQPRVNTQVITKTKGIYRTPAFSPDGKKIVFTRENGHNDLGPGYTATPGVYIMDADGTDVRFITRSGNQPVWNKAGDRIFLLRGGGLSKQLVSCKLDGTDEKIHLRSTYGSQFTLSPDENWVAFIDLHKVYIATFTQTGKTIELGAETKDYPVRQVARDAGINLHWSANGEKLHYTLGSEYFTVQLKDRFGFITGTSDTAFKIPEKGIAVNLNTDMYKPKGVTAFTNARIITMQGNKVIEKGTVIVENNIIQSVTEGNAAIPQGAAVINCEGKTITPGFIDMHAHGDHFYSGITPQKHWAYYANLAYGVTTMHDPSSNSEYVFGLSELAKAGKITAPRVFSTGTILYGADGDFKAVINSADDARSALRRTKAYGAFSVKSYNQPRREQRQMIIQAAKELNMLVVPEGGSFFYHNMSMILDGHTTIEHNIPIATLYDDVVQVWKNSKTGYTPTLIVSYGSVSGEYYWYQHTNVWEKERLLKFTPRSVIDTRSRHRTMLPEEEYVNGHILVSQSVKKLADAGVLVNMGAHGQIQGIGAHWEIWMLQQGGMTPLQALQAATINPAINLGMDKYIGSIEPGKLADLLVMDKNPLENIRNTESLRYTMVNGILYDAETMAGAGNNKATAPVFYWNKNKNAESYPWYSTEETTGCHCGKH